MLQMIKLNTVFLIIILILSQAETALACTSKNSLKQELKSHSHVFLGAVESCSKQDQITFSVQKIWKGEKTYEYKATIPCSNSFFKSNKKYLIFANSTNQKDIIEISYGAISCHRTAEVMSPIKAHFKNFLSKFNGNPVEANYINHDIKQLGAPLYIMK